MEMYQKRLRLFACDYSFWEIPTQNFSNQHLILQKKIDSLAKGQQKLVILLREQGQNYTSVQFAKWVNNQIAQSYTLFFIIGAHLGFNETTLKLYPEGLSLSPMTLPHQLVPLIFFEQLYRAETLVENKPYHY
jgi:rRNA large subunit m3Psi methyltransferase RlmH